MKDDNTFGPFFNLPLNSGNVVEVSIGPNGKLTLNTDLCEGGRYWIIVYTSGMEEFLRILAVNPQIVEYKNASTSGIDLIVTHWKEIDGEIVQCNHEK